ncbi:MAG: hypothetical protein Q8P65_00715 [bacterium]|nr:hypothetical protein [bacterium]
MVYLGYYQRGISSSIYIIIICLLFYFHYFFIRRYKTINLFILTLGIVLTLIASYPFLSHDFFNYLFDAKILTVYGKNPYLYKALDFPKDPWLIFMHWTHRTYPYGPFFLGFSLIPSFLSFGKLILNFIFFKFMFAGFYILGVYFLNKINKKYALFFATSPLILVEGLINNHNDFIALSLGLTGIYFLLKNKKIYSYLFFILSSGIKYITIPIVFISKNISAFTNKVVFSAMILILLYLSIFFEIQPWYFLALFLFMTFFYNLVSKLNIFFAGLLFSYFPFIAYGDWGMGSNLKIKHSIIVIFFIINIIYLFMYNFSNAKKTSK